MSSRVLSPFWLWRDLPLTYVLLVWIAFGATLFFYFNDWPAFRQEAAAVRQLKNEEFYTGSIIIVPARGNHCWQRMLDNRTGKFWEKGFVNCDDAVAQLVEQKQRGSMSSLRMQAISKVFRHAGD